MRTRYEGGAGAWVAGVLAALGDWRLGSRKNSALEGYGNQFWPVHSSILAWRTPLTEKPGGPQFTGLQRVGHNRSNLASIGIFACGSFGPVKVEHEGGIVAWVVGTLATPSVLGQGLPLPQELRLCQSLFSSLW